MKKLGLIIVIIIILFVAFFKVKERFSIKNKANLLVNNFTANDYETLKDWSVFNRGDLELWRRTDDGGISTFNVFQNKRDTNILWVPVNGKYDSKHIINTADTIISGEIIIKKYQGEILGVYKKELDKNKAILNNIKATELTLFSKLIKEFSIRSETKNKFNAFYISSHSESQIIKFYVSRDDVIVYCKDGKESFLLENSNIQNELKGLKWINNYWFKYIAVTKLDFG